MQSKKITKYLLSIYILFLIWIILFKMSLPFQNLSHIRSINLIPFAAPAVTNGTINLDEIIANFIAFLPFGIFTGILLETKSVQNTKHHLPAGNICPVPAYRYSPCSEFITLKTPRYILQLPPGYAMITDRNE